MIARLVFRQTTFDERDETFILKRLYFLPHGSGNWQREKLSHVSLQPFQRHKLAVLHRPEHRAQMRNERDDEHFFSGGNVFRVRVRVKHPCQLGMLVDVFPGFSVLLIYGD